MAHVETILKLAKVLLQMLLRNVNVRSTDGVLKAAPEVFNRVRMNRAAHPYFTAMIDAVQFVAFAVHVVIRNPFVRMKRGALFHVRFDDRLDRGTARALDNLRHYIPVALQHPEHGSFLGATPRLAGTLNAGLSTDVGFVGLRVARQPIVAIGRGYVLADLMAHAPSRLVRHAKLALEFLGRDAMPRSCEEVHGVKPLLERRMGRLKGRSDHRMNMMPTPGALVGGQLGNARKLAVLAALGTVQFQPEPEVYQAVEAGVIVGKPLEEVGNRELLGHRFPSSTRPVWPIQLHTSGG